jgi:hypothetical protein
VHALPYDRAVPDGERLGDLTERAMHALRNSLGNMAALAYVIDDTPGVDREVVRELLRNMALVALDAELLADLAVMANAREPAAAPLLQLLADAVRPLQWFTWLGGSEAGAIQVAAADEIEAPFLRPGEVVATGRRLVASVIGRCRPPGIVLEASSLAGGVQLAARDVRVAARADLPEANAERDSGGNYLDLEVLALGLRRPGLDARFYQAADGSYAAARLLRV